MKKEFQENHNQMEATLKSKHSTETFEISERCKMFEEKYLEAIKNQKEQKSNKETDEESAESKLKIKLRKELDQKRDENKAITLKYVKLKAEMKTLTTSFKKNQSLLKLREQEIALYQDIEGGASSSTSNNITEEDSAIIKKECQE